MQAIRGMALSFLIFCVSPAFTQTITDTSDLGITATVHNRLAADPVFTGVPIQVSTTNGVVSLTGNLRNENQFMIAIQSAEATQGVKDVDTSQLQINGRFPPVSDAEITAKVSGLFLQQNLFGDPGDSAEVSKIPIKVQTHAGIVTLTGVARNQHQLNLAIKLAQSIPGVRQVKSSVKVSLLP